MLLAGLALLGAWMLVWIKVFSDPSAGTVRSGSRARKRGPGYVGAFGILLFLLSTAAQLGLTSSGQSPSHSLIGWPLVLLLLGVAGLLAPLLRRRYD